MQLNGEIYTEQQKKREFLNVLILNISGVWTHTWFKFSLYLQPCMRKVFKKFELCRYANTGDIQNSPIKKFAFLLLFGIHCNLRRNMPCSPRPNIQCSPRSNIPSNLTPNIHCRLTLKY